MKQKFKGLLFFTYCLNIAVGMYAIINPFQRICDDLTCLPSLLPEGFGKTHFIVGFPHEKVTPHKKPLQKKESSLTNDDLQVLFSPDDDLQQALIELINSERESIKMAIFCFTDKDIAQALLNAHKRGVLIEIITDPAQLKDRYSKISTLQQAGLPIFEYNPSYIKDMRSNLMHHKFVVFGKKRVWTGSFNFTDAARKRNQENVVIARDDYLVEKFCAQFDCLKKRCIGCKKITKNSYTNSHGLCTASLEGNSFNIEAGSRTKKNTDTRNKKTV